MRKELAEEAAAATVVQSRFRGHNQRKEAKQEADAATAIQSRFLCALITIASKS
jgi:hypothetical protein